MNEAQKNILRYAKFSKKRDPDDPLWQDVIDLIEAGGRTPDQRLTDEQLMELSMLRTEVIGMRNNDTAAMNAARFHLPNYAGISCTQEAIAVLANQRNVAREATKVMSEHVDATPTVTVEADANGLTPEDIRHPESMMAEQLNLAKYELMQCTERIAELENDLQTTREHLQNAVWDEDDWWVPALARLRKQMPSAHLPTYEHCPYPRHRPTEGGG